MNLQWLFSGAGDAPLPCGQGHRSARGWTLPHPLTPSSTPTHAPRREPGLRGAQRPPSPALPPSSFTSDTGGWGMAVLGPTASSLSSRTYGTKPKRLSAEPWQEFCPMLEGAATFQQFSLNLLLAWTLQTLPGSLSPARPHCHSRLVSGCANKGKLWSHSGTLVSDGNVPPVLEERVVAFDWWLWKLFPGWGIGLTSWRHVTKGAEGVSSCFWIVWSDYVLLGEVIRKQKHKDSSWTFVLFCTFSFFTSFFFIFFSPMKLSACLPAGSSGNNMLRQFITLSLGRAYHCYIRELLKELLRSRWLFENLYQELTSPALPCS